MVRRVSLLGVVCAAGAYTTIRAIGKRASPLHSVAFFALYSTVVSGALMWYLEEAFVIPSGGMWLSLLFLVGLFGLLAQTLMTYGLQLETAGRVSTRQELETCMPSSFSDCLHPLPYSLCKGYDCRLLASDLLHSISASRSESSSSSSFSHWVCSDSERCSLCHFLQIDLFFTSLRLILLLPRTTSF